MANGEAQCMTAIFNDVKAVLREHKDKRTYASMKEISSMYDLASQVWRRLYKSTAVKLSMSRLLRTVFKSNGIAPPTMHELMCHKVWRQSYYQIHLMPWYIMSTMRGKYTLDEKERACYAFLDTIRDEIKKHATLKHKKQWTKA